MRRLDRVSAEDDKAELLEQLLELNPTMLQLKEKRGDIKRELDSLSRKIAGKKRTAERGIFDVPSSRSSYDISLLSGSDTALRLVYSLLTGDEAILDASLHKPMLCTVRYKDIPLQMIALPPVFATDFDLTPDKYRLLRRMDEIVQVIETPAEYEIVMRELLKSGLRLYSPQGKAPDGQGMIPSFVVNAGGGEITSVLAILNSMDGPDILEEIYRHLGIMRVYSRPDQEPSKTPIIFNTGEAVTVRSVAEDLGEKFLRDFRYARVWDSLGNTRSENALLDYCLSDGDMVRFYLR